MFALDNTGKSKATVWLQPSQHVVHFQNRATMWKVDSFYCSTRKVIISRIFGQRIHDQIYLMFSVASPITDTTVAAELGIGSWGALSFCNTSIKPHWHNSLYSNKQPSLVILGRLANFGRCLSVTGRFIHLLCRKSLGHKHLCWSLYLGVATVLLVGKLSYHS